MTKQRELYEVPTISVVEMKQEGVICQSLGAEVEDYNWNELVIE
jgi:hypothetical protein